MATVGKIVRIVLYLLVLECVFVIHEYGHYTEFVERNIPVKEFSLGIGPAVYQHQVDDLTLSFRLIPIAAYVAATDEGYKTHMASSFMDKFWVSSAGVRNNLISGLGAVLILNVIGWKRGFIDGSLLLSRTVIYPFKLVYIFILFFIDSLTFRKFSLGENCRLYTGDILPPLIVHYFIYLSFLLGCLNFLPLYPLDGGKTFIEVLSLFSSLEVITFVQKISQLLMFIFIFGYGVSRMEFVEYDEPGY